jgi:hypothetical protein
MKFKSLLSVVAFIPTLVMAQGAPKVEAPVAPKAPSAGIPGANGGGVKPVAPIAVNPSAKLPAAPNSPNLATKPPAPQNPAMAGFQATHGGNMGSAPQQQSPKPLAPGPQKGVGSIPPHNIGDF